MRQGDTGRPRPQDVIAAFGLLTRLPLPRTSAAPRGSASAWAWPLVGMVTGSIGALAASIALWLGLPVGFAAAAALAAQIFATGALHEDGLADTADGLFGGWTRERRLEIMKDSRIGSYGTLALITVALARWSSIAALCTQGQLWPALITAGAISRVPMAVLMVALPNARSAGLSHAVGRPPWLSVGLAAAIAGVVGLALLGGALFAMAGLAALSSLWLAITAKARIGGQTGDILGASQQLAEVSALAVAVAMT